MTTGYQHTTAASSESCEYPDLVERAGSDVIVRALDPNSSLSPIPCIRGIHSVDRCELWVEAANKVGSRAKTKRLLRQRRDYLAGERDSHSEIEGDVDEGSSEQDEKAGVSTDEDANGDAPDRGRGGDGDSASGPTPSRSSVATPSAPPADVDPDMVASIFTEVDDIRDRLETERGRDDPRQDVIDALENRLRELESEPEANDTRQAATDGGRR